VGIYIFIHFIVIYDLLSMFFFVDPPDSSSLFAGRREQCCEEMEVECGVTALEWDDGRGGDFTVSLKYDRIYDYP